MGWPAARGTARPLDGVNVPPLFVLTWTWFVAPATAAMRSLSPSLSTSAKSMARGASSSDVDVVVNAPVPSPVKSVTKAARDGLPIALSTKMAALRA